MLEFFIMMSVMDLILYVLFSYFTRLLIFHASHLTIRKMIFTKVDILLFLFSSPMYVFFFKSK